jgi:ribosomal-protein-alanine N-acetyltransferase
MMLNTDRLVLREFVADDWHAVLAYQSDSRYLQYYPWTKRTAQEVQAFVQRFIGWQAEEPRIRFQLAVVLRTEGQLIGTCGIRMGAANIRKADLGYEIAPSYWGQGYATEGSRAMLGFGFEELGLHRVWASCLAENAASARVLEKLGMRCEGRLRDNHWITGRWWDTLVYGMIEDEWKARKE